MISAEEAYKLTQENKIAADIKQLEKIETEICKEISIGGYCIYIDYIRENVEKELIDLGYKINKEPKCSFGNEIEYVISWGNDDE